MQPVGELQENAVMFPGTSVTGSESLVSRPVSPQSIALEVARLKCKHTRTVMLLKF